MQYSLALFVLGLFGIFARVFKSIYFHAIAIVFAVGIDCEAENKGIVTEGKQSYSVGKILEIRKGSRIGFVGGGLGSRMNIFNEFETALQRRYPENRLYIRNFCKEGDTPGFRPHPSRADFYAFPGAKDLMPVEFQRGKGKGHFPTPDQWLTNHRIDVVIGFFGYTSSFAGAADIDRYKKELTGFIEHTRKQNYCGKGAPQIAIVSPAAFENSNLEHQLPYEENNKNLELYTQAMAEVCAEKGVRFVDAFSITRNLYDSSNADLTINGHHLNALGYRKFSPLLADALFERTEVKGDYAKTNAAVSEKNRLWLSDYKIPNGIKVHGRRCRSYGSDPKELQKTREMTDIRDLAIWAVNTDQDFDIEAADSKTTPLTPFVKNYRMNNSLSHSSKKTSFELAKGYEIQLFADQKTFPNLNKPTQMAFDNKGRLWVSCAASYPGLRAGEALPNDKILILEDTNNDGVADKETVFVDKIRIPMGFEISDEGGVYVAQGNDLVHFTDTDGDSSADKKVFVLSGVDNHDTYHSISSFCADPSGAIYMAEGNFCYSNVETAYGTVRGTNGGFYRFNPKKGHLERAAQYAIPNPWGIAFDEWGQNFFLHGSSSKLSWMQQTAGKNRYHFNLQAPDIITSNSARPTSGLEFISSRHFPDEVQGDVLICNKVGFYGAKQHQVLEDERNGGYTSKFRQNLFVTENSNFSPVDLEFAPDGSLFVVDWNKAQMGHMSHGHPQVRPDAMHGRIYRITYPTRPLVKPPKIDGATIEELLENLKLPEYRARYRTRRELRGRDSEKVTSALDKWVAELNPNNDEYERQLTEAMWVSWGTGKIDKNILQMVLKAKDHRARAAAVRAVRYNMDELPDWEKYLYQAAKDIHSLVRHEAVVQASWLDPAIGRKIVKRAKEQVVAKNSEAAIKAAIDIFDENWNVKNRELPPPSGLLKNTKEESVVQIICKPVSLEFDIKKITLEKGKKIKLIFINADALSHNIVIVKPGKADAVAQEAIQLGARDDKQHWVPENPDVIVGSKLLARNQKQVLNFKFDESGKYPFILISAVGIMEFPSQSL